MGFNSAFKGLISPIYSVDSRRSHTETYTKESVPSVFPDLYI